MDRHVVDTLLGLFFDNFEHMLAAAPVVALLPLYFLPPPVDRPDVYYGFIGVALVLLLGAFVGLSLMAGSPTPRPAASCRRA